VGRKLHVKVESKNFEFQMFGQKSDRKGKEVKGKKVNPKERGKKWDSEWPHLQLSAMEERS